MKLTETNGLFNFEAENIEEGRVLKMFIQHMADDCYELRLKSYSYDRGRPIESNITGIYLEWEKGSLNEMKNKIKECIEFGEPIPIEVLEEYNKLSAGFL